MTSSPRSSDARDPLDGLPAVPLEVLCSAFPDAGVPACRRLQRLTQATCRTLMGLWQGVVRRTSEQPPLAPWGPSTRAQREVALRMARLWHD